ncbi:hypothetical protein I4F81_003446 [Pyropia yezoensis]|uniref:Uncharacterized protein n=1 Tax=Pyropia yezoensis TaxID=2788 RepID=A0ACC3BSK9_PYRYE|nr:hypothetical protein I4F81_003446 [Neopyropia yezoensis]
MSPRLHCFVAPTGLGGAAPGGAAAALPRIRGPQRPPAVARRARRPTTMAVPTLTSAAADYIATSIPDVGTVLPPKSGPSGSGWASTAVVDTSSGRSFFVKTAPRPAAAMFVAEAAGLRALAAAAAASGAEVVIPTAYAARDGDGGSFLVMDAVPMGGRVDMARLGDAVGAIHAAPPPPADVAGGTGYGFGVTAGTIGGSVQRNGWMDDWPAFWVERRLRPQLAATRDDALIREGAKLCDAVPAFFADVPAPAASCLHGDLWGGNYGATPEGVPVLFDPATYYGHAEAEFGMSWCASFNQRFYDAYHARMPRAAGADAREDLYTLYHILNHANLFGGGYRSQAAGLIKSLLRRA